MIGRWLRALLPTDENAFSAGAFQDIFYPITAAAGVLLIVTIVLYNVQTRRQRRHPPLVAMWEWILWTAVVVYGLVLVEAVFHFWFVTVVATLVIGLGTFVWIRFFHFRPSSRPMTDRSDGPGIWRRSGRPRAIRTRRPR
ncbi:MAG: hypothetical protein R3C32_04630 [Chloroflexota bacterium]